MSDLVVLADSRDREKWLKAREGVLSASDVASCLGFGYQSRSQLHKAKVTGEREDLSKLAQVEAGQHFEPAVAGWFSADRGIPTSPYNRLITRSDAPWLGATPDYTTIDDVPVECKNVGFETRANWHEGSLQTKGWPKNLSLPVPEDIKSRYATVNLKVAKDDEGTLRGNFRSAIQTVFEFLLPALGAPRAPLKYWSQLQIQMLLLKQDHGYIVAAVGGTSRIDLLYKRDDDFLEYAMSVCEPFWKGVQAAREAMREVA